MAGLWHDPFSGSLKFEEASCEGAVMVYALAFVFAHTVPLWLPVLALFNTHC